jgi:predicted nucleic acid-binding Zn ribbon protein
VQQKFSDPVVGVCRLCNSTKVRKLLSPPGFVLKGSGWYVTDYPSADRKKACEPDKPKTEPSSSGAGCAAGGCSSGGCSSKG